MKTILLAVLSIVSCSSTAGLTQQLSLPAVDRFRLPPVDESVTDPAFHAFREQLLDAVKARDAQFLMATSVPELSSLFHQTLALPSRVFIRPETEHADWKHLEQLLSMGGVFTTVNGRKPGRREFCAPYTYSAFPGHVERNRIVQAVSGWAQYAEGDLLAVLAGRGES